MPENTSNGFSELITDLHPYNTPPTVMTDAINVTITTDGDNQFILQNKASNEYVTQLTRGFQPIGIATHKNIAYIISAKFDANGVFEEGEIGTYPSPDWANLNHPSTNWPIPLQPPVTLSTQFVDLKPIYSPLYNFISGGFIAPSGSTQLDVLIDNYLLTHPTLTREEAGNIVLNQDAWYNEPFRSNKFDFKNDRLIEVELQESYDNSINIIFTDNSNKVRLVNSRFILSADGRQASLANRRQGKDTNVYSEERFFSTNLLRTSDKIADLDLIGVPEGGQLPCGNYKVYLKYSDTDGSLSDLVEESRLISVGLGNRGGTDNEISDRYIHMRLKNLDYKFSSVKVYYYYLTGDTEAVGVFKEISNTYPIPNSGDMDIFIYGNEFTKDIDIDQFNLDYSSINTVRSFAQHDDRLVDANISNYNSDLDTFRDISQQIAIFDLQSPDLIIKPDAVNSIVGYGDPMNVYYKLGLWAGETYELGICYILTNGRGVTPSFPIRGIDNVIAAPGVNNYTLSSVANLKYEPIDTLDGYYIDPSGTPNVGEINKENRLGVYRTRRERTMLLNGDVTSTTGNNSFGDTTNILYVSLDTSILHNTNIVTNKFAQFITANVEGFFIVRKERKRDCLLQGYITNANKVRLYPHVNYELTENYQFNRLKIENTGGTESYSDHIVASLDPNGNFTVGNNLDGKIVPHPGQISEFAITKSNLQNSFIPPAANFEWYSPVLAQAGNPEVFNTSRGNEFYMNGPDSYAVFYTPDMLVNAPLVASLFKNDKKGLMISNTTLRMGAILDATKSMNVNPLLWYQTGYWSNKILDRLELNDNTFSPEYTISYGYTNNNADNYMQYVNEYQDAFVNNQFSALSNRNLYCRISNVNDIGKISGLDYTTLTHGPSETAGLGVDSMRYSDYIGIKFSDKTPGGSGTPTPTNLWTPLRGGGPVRNGVNNIVNSTDFILSSYAGASNVIQPDRNASELFLHRFQFEGIDFGVQANVYNSESGATQPSSATNSDWKNKYSNTNNSESYFAMSKRISLKDFRANAGYVVFGFPVTTGGDCFINYAYKRAWYAPGIENVPTASDPRAYSQYNYDTSLSPKGLVFPMVCESNYNISMRSFQLKDETEQALYGKERSFYPFDDLKQLRRSKQLESKGYNKGYNDSNSIKSHFNLDDEAPALGLSYDTRILISAPSISGSFTNGYTDFSGLNFRDYAKNLGQINKVISYNGSLFCIQDNGVSIVPMNQRTMVSEQQGGVFLDDGQLLGQKLLYISTEYGSDQQFSVIKSDNFIYGCSFDKNKIWRIEPVEGGTKTLKVISDFKIQKILNKFKKRCIDNLGTQPFVKANYDRRTNAVIFTYFCLENSKFSTDENINSLTQPRMTSIGSVYFNETTGKWMSRLSWDPLFMFNLGSNVFSFNSKTDNNKIWKHFSESPIKCNFYGKQEKFEFEFIIVEDSTRQKILNNMLVVCNREFPGRLTLSVDDDVNLERPDTWNSTPGIGSTTGPNIVSTTQLMRQRHEDFKYTILSSIIGTTSGTLELLFEMSIEEAERLNGGWFEFGGNVYVFGNISNTTAPNSNQLYIEILNQNLNIVTSIPSGLAISVVNFGILKQNMDYIEDHLYIEISKNKDNSRIRDKYLRVRFSYEGMDYITIQKIISSFDYSFS